MELQLLCLFTLIISILPAWIGLSNYRWHKNRQSLAESQGWRYASEKFGLFSRQFTIAGASDAGKVWEITREKSGGRHYLSWESSAAKLPHGRLWALPAENASPDGLPPAMRQLDIPHPLNPGYLLFVSHDQLAHRYFSEEALPNLEPMPAFPQPGSLNRIHWSKTGLIVQFFYQMDWQTVERLVKLGESLSELTAKSK